ncbi:acyltransferase [Enterobacter asburiae]|uniref:acyltransferase family protein n=1 Tax=Enterobacter asburiae TaxID=61645 RepID=UPI0020758C2E|nr:acyltransferase family protein [Enterobacter asburiae]MCM7771309.1 acyltransferase [Enterobacter asburiae]
MLKYRADIDGLRAIAVALVVLYHAKFPVNGGFIGVDIFFVISGYLITNIIYKETKQNNFSFLNFYKRRIKRLLPAYIFLLVILFIYCKLYLMPDELISFAKSSVYSLLGISNFYFFNGTGYFNSTTYEPLLHTWSLSVEEQFYIIWPFIVFMLARFAGTKRALTISAALFLLFLAVSQYGAVNYKTAAYLLLPFRFFELMSGALLAVYSESISKHLRHGSAISLFGLLLIIFSAMLINSDMPFPGVTVLPACLGSVMLIASGSSPKNVVSKVLSITPVIYVGRISYSLYLWHWPVLILAEYRGIDLTSKNAAGLILFAFIMASISYHLIEKPFRKNLLKTFKPAFILLYILPLIASAVYAKFILLNDGFRAENAALVAELEEKNAANIMRPDCIDKLYIGKLDTCYLGIKNSHPDGVLIGDSFANAYAYFVDALAKNAGVTITDTAYSSTPVISGIYVQDIRNKIRDIDAQLIMTYTKDRIEYAARHKFAIISVFWDQYGPQNTYFRIFNETGDVSEKAYQLQADAIKYLLSHGVKVYILARPFDTIGSAAINKLRQIKLRHGDTSAELYAYGTPKNERIEYRLKSEFPQITVIDPNDILCSKGNCRSIIDGKIIFRTDGAHLNAIGAKKIGEEYLKQNENPLK